MTPAAATTLRRLAERRLAEIRAEAAELEAALRDMRAEPVAPAADAAAGPVAAAAPSPLESRLELLREAHGPVYVIEPGEPVEIGQKIQYGSPPRPVEILEPAPPGKGGLVRYFAKLVVA